MTSKFSGCRFAIDSHGLSHVSWQGIDDRTGLMSSSSSSRDYREMQSRFNQRPSFRRTLSISRCSTSPSWCSDSATQTYGIFTPELSSHALVFGYREGNTWNFKVLKFHEFSPNFGTLHDFTTISVQP